MPPHDGAVPMIAKATASQPPMTHHARRTTNWPSLPNMRAPYHEESRGNDLVWPATAAAGCRLVTANRQVWVRRW
jgi:hypothetical protein